MAIVNQNSSSSEELPIDSGPALELEDKLPDGLAPEVYAASWQKMSQSEREYAWKHMGPNMRKEARELLVSHPIVLGMFNILESKEELQKDREKHQQGENGDIPAADLTTRYSPQNQSKNDTKASLKAVRTNTVTAEKEGSSKSRNPEQGPGPSQQNLKPVSPSKGGDDGGNKKPPFHTRAFSWFKGNWILVAIILIVLAAGAFLGNKYVFNSAPANPIADSLNRQHRMQKHVQDSIARADEARKDSIKTALTHYQDSIERVTQDSLEIMKARNHTIQRYSKKSWFTAFVSDNGTLVWALAAAIVLFVIILVKFPKEKDLKPSEITSRRIAFICVMLLFFVACWLAVNRDPVNLSGSQKSALEDKIRSEYQNNPITWKEKVYVPDPTMAAEVAELKQQNKNLIEANRSLNGQLRNAIHDRDSIAGLKSGVVIEKTDVVIDSNEIHRIIDERIKKNTPVPEEKKVVTRQKPADIRTVTTTRSKAKKRSYATKRKNCPPVVLGHNDRLNKGAY